MWASPKSHRSSQPRRREIPTVFSSLVSLWLLSLVLPFVILIPLDTVVPMSSQAFAQGAKAKAKRSKSNRPRPSRQVGVRSQFSRAQKLYNAGKFREAAAAYDAILRRFPGHEPSRLQLAKTYYRLDRIRDSYVIFSRINPTHFDPETSYEYAWSFYMSKQWEGALFGFKRIPKGNALYDLANYYGGISAIKLKRYDEAEDMLERSVVLPDKLAKSRSVYLRHVTALRLLKEKSKLRRERQKERDRLKAEREAQKPPAKTPEPPKEYQHDGLMSPLRAAYVQYEVERQLRDFHGFATETHDAQTASFNLSSGVQRPFPAGPSGPKRRTVLGGQLDLSAEDRNQKGEEERFIVQESDSDLQRVLVEENVRHSKAGRVGGKIWVETPLPQNVWFALVGTLSFKYPDFERENRSGNRGGFAQLGGSAHGIFFSGRLIYTELLNRDTEPTITIVTGEGDATAGIGDKLTVSVSAAHKTYDYLIQSDQEDGPDAITGGYANVTQQFPLGIAAFVGGSYEFHANHNVHRMPTFGTIAADGQIIAGHLGLSITTLPWFAVSLRQSFIKKSWEVTNPEAKEVFETNNSDYVETSTGSISLNLAF